MNQEVERRVGIKKDLQGIIKLLSILVHQKNIKVTNQEEYQDFLRNITKMINILEINFDLL